MNFKVLVVALLAATIAGTALAFSLTDQEREREREREVRREQSERPHVHALGVALELQKKLELSENQIGQLLERWQVYKPAQVKHIELIAKLRAQYEDSDGEKRQGLGNRIESTIKEFNNWSEKLTRETFEIVGADRTELIRKTMREINGRRGGERERTRVHPLAMALEHQRDLGLRENQLPKIQDMWAEYKEVKAKVDARLQDLEKELVSYRERGVGEQDIAELQKQMQGLRQELAGYSENKTKQLLELLGAEQEQVLRSLLSGTREREGGQEREFARAVEELKAAVAAGRLTGNEAEQRIAEMRQNMRDEGGRDVARKPKNPIGHHMMAYALEGRQKIRMTEEQYGKLRPAWLEIYAVGNRIGGQMRELEKHAANLREAGEWNDRSAREVNTKMDEQKGRLERLHNLATVILEETLNKEQMNGAADLMMAARSREGGSNKVVNAMQGHPMAWALELHEKLGLNEKQIGRLKESYTGLRKESDGLSERQSSLQKKLADLRESGKLTDGSEREFAGAFKNIGMDREALQAKGSEVLKDTLNKEQLAQLRKIIEERSRNDG